jgi:hypothetical protein
MTYFSKITKNQVNDQKKQAWSQVEDQIWSKTKWSQAAPQIFFKVNSQAYTRVLNQTVLYLRFQIS